VTPETYRGYRVAIVGGCQTAGLAEWIRRLLPGAEVRNWHADTAPAAILEVAQQIAGSDLVVTQFSDDMDAGALEVTRLREHFANVVFMPVLVFAGFHPDIACCGLAHQPFAFIRGPLDILQSTISLAAYHLDLRASRVPRLYNSLTFEALGYVGAFAGARAAFLDVFAAHGYGLADAFDGWMRDGCFMYSDNHPHIRVLGSFARLILGKAGLPAAVAATSETPADGLADSVHWPVYPALGRPIGIAGSTVFTRAAHGVPASEARELTLQAFVEASYRVFAAVGRERLDRVPRVARATETLRSLLA